ncbi:HSP90 family protein [Emticicia fluvialis]|uniref:HSP90 family protein n=1 Tax=Emticicia fluvialis TaxID=2974474 RepID=UPI00216626FA|nr:HSP90 family protein [Emticicia fluvialis]
MKKAFQVNLEGVLDVLSNHLYSSEHVFIRELLQNATDAITARKFKEFDSTPSIHVELYEHENHYELIFEDNGIGLTLDEVNNFLSSIGSSTKRGYFTESRDTFIGQFGIGLLSCFMVSENIVIITKSEGNKPIKWVGRIDGTYEVSELDIEMEIGTKVFLSAKKGYEYLFTEHEISSLLKKYGEILPFPIYFKSNESSSELVNRIQPVWETKYSNSGTKRAAYIEYGRETFHLKFKEYVEINLPNVKGIMYLLPMAVSPSNRNRHKVFLKNMLLSDEIESILPRWAFFFKAVLNVTNLRPTASRESLYEDKNLESTRFELGKTIKRYFKDLALENPDKLARIFEIHSETFKMVALEDDEFFDLIINEISFSTNKGPRKLNDIKEDVINYIHDLDEFRKVSQISHSKDITIINSFYGYDYELLIKLQNKGYEKPIIKVDIGSFFKSFGNLNASESEECELLLEVATIALEKFRCKPDIKRFSPAALPSLYYMSESVGFQRTIDQVSSISDNLWGGILDTFSQTSSINFSVICFNYENKLIKKLIKSTHRDVIYSIVELIYVNSLLLGHHPLNSKEVEVLNNKLYELIEKTV